MEKLNKLNFNKGGWLLAATVFGVALFASCENEDEPHKVEVTVMDIKGKNITGDTIDVAVNSINQTLFEVWYMDNDKVFYERQIDNEEIENLKESEDLHIESGRSKSNGSRCSEMSVTTRFTDSLVHVGSLVKISARVSSDAYGEVVYKVTE